MVYVALTRKLAEFVYKPQQLLGFFYFVTRKANELCAGDFQVIA
jgi:hypothetical protein